MFDYSGTKLPGVARDAHFRRRRAGQLRHMKQAYHRRERRAARRALRLTWA